MCDVEVTNAGGDGGSCACRGVVAGPEYGGVCVAGCCGAERCCRLEDGGVAGGTDKCEVEPSCWEDRCFLTHIYIYMLSAFNECVPFENRAALIVNTIII